MGAKYFQCTDGATIEIETCLKECRMKQRCLFLPTLRSVAESLERNIDGLTVTELINGTCEMYLKKTTDYIVDPMQRLYAIQGTAAHVLHQAKADGNMLGEVRIHGDYCSGQIDLYGAILDGGEETLGDYKVTSSYKLMRALGKYAVSVPTGEYIKSGPRKGLEKTLKEIRDGGVRYIQDWAIQLNCYRMLLEKEGFTVNRIVILAFCRDYGLQIAKQRGIDAPAYLIEINRISDRWLKRYIKAKADKLNEALEKKQIPSPCSSRERWHDRKCTGYCEVSSFCPYTQSLKKTTAEVA